MVCSIAFVETDGERQGEEIELTVGRKAEYENGVEGEGVVCTKSSVDKLSNMLEIFKFSFADAPYLMNDTINKM